MTVRAPLTCVCCGVTEGDRDRDGVAVDPTSGLCLFCQPCPYCHRFGTDCDDERGDRGCVP